ncbi:MULTISPECIES: VCBS repeat-containing protein [unclassified Streptomyces]|uniref:FG-GAP repeat domain-containing protein n=1 Tax=unclassified Streptomyces TaxID=2593676 RepID=UPI000DC53D4B|nr:MULTISPECIES: VCBS repeat-containing protein [unclassified Streptomyces]RAJ82530.1 VCBS repeat protein [Streptomyces sp. PsTaAH-137]
MDVEQDEPKAERKRGGTRRWMIAAGAAVAAVAVAGGVVLARSGAPGIAAPGTCHTTAHGTAPSAAPATSGRAPAGTAPAADFDGDGHPDLAMGALGDVENAGGGSIAVAYGSGDGTGLARCQHLTQNDAAIPGKADYEAYFGSWVAARDFDGDGYTDLATAVYDDEPSVIIMWGSPDGLKSAARVPGTDGSHVSWALDPILEERLVAGDFDGDGHADLVFGLGSDKGLLKGPFTRDGSPASTGPVSAPRRPAQHIRSANYEDLVAGDLDGDGADELIAFHHDEPLGTATYEERRPVSYFHARRGGLVQPDGVDLPDAAAGAVGDVDGDGLADLVLSPRRGKVSDGAVSVVYGSRTGPGNGEPSVTIDRDTPGVPGAVVKNPGNEDAAYTSLDTGDVDGDGYADVVAGFSRDEAHAKTVPEQVMLLLGGPDGLTGEGAQVVDAGDIGGDRRTRGAFGLSVRLVDMNGDHRADLTVTAPGDDEVRSSAWVLPGTGHGLSTDGVTRLDGDSFESDGKRGLYMGGGGIAR